MKHILIFPCGSEVALELFRSLRYIRIFKLFGASSVNDHGRFVFKNYIGDIPFLTDPGFIEKLKWVVAEYQIDAIYPAMDAVAATLKKHEAALGCRVISASEETVAICASKKKTYQRLADHIPTPEVYENASAIRVFPVFLKPDQGYGSRGTAIAQNQVECEQHIQRNEDKFRQFIISEYLPGEEYTIDCFTNRHGELLYAGARKRGRISNGISVNTTLAQEIEAEARAMAETINQQIAFRGAWFFQLKRNKQGKLTLLEVASRIAGSSALYRNKGVNFGALSVFDAFDMDVSVMDNDYGIEMDRALDNRYKLTIIFDTVYFDFDDCILLGDQVNEMAIRFIFQCINRKVKLVLITKHAGDIHQTLSTYRLNGLFDQIIHLSAGQHKHSFIQKDGAIFIDDSFQERKEVQVELGIPVFAPDMIEALL